MVISKYILIFATETVYYPFLMKIYRIVSLLLLVFLACAAYATEAELDELDSYVERRDQYMAAKQSRIDALKQKLQSVGTNEERLNLYDDIFEEYYTYRFDSAMVYVKRGLQLAEQIQSSVYTDNFLIHRGLLLATSGYYSQAEAVLRSVDIEQLHPSLKFKYYYSMSWLYNFWCAYCNDSEFAPKLAELRLQYLREALNYTPAGGAMYNYLQGEKLYYEGRQRESMTAYAKVLKQVSVSERLYASAAYALARGYKLSGKMDLYETYIIRAGISDQVCPLKENLALQELSLYLYEKDESNSGRAVRYIYCSMEDAQFYNNRLGMLEISHILPRIVAAYQTQIDKRTTVTKYALIGVSLLLLVLLFMTAFVYKQNKKLNQRRLKLREQNQLLENLNQQLTNTNQHRETYLRLFLDMSALYIGKLEGFRKMVSRNIKAGKTTELLQKIDRVRVSDEEARDFYDRFDRAFLILYPDFVDNLNHLLRDDSQVRPEAAHSLTTELRIYALMRLGVTASSEIATLLFYSTQTIYNYKSAMKSRAKNRDTFDRDVNALCHVVPGAGQSATEPSVDGSGDKTE